MTPYLTFNGQCEAAFKFYETALGGKIVAMLRHGDVPMGGPVPPEAKNHIPRPPTAAAFRRWTKSAGLVRNLARTTPRLAVEQRHRLGNSWVMRQVVEGRHRPVDVLIVDVGVA